MDKVAQLDPVAKLIRAGEKLALTPAQAVRLDSIAAEMLREVAPFMARIDSLTPLAPPGPGQEGRAGIGALADGLAQVELRYQAGLQSALMALTDPQAEKALRLVEKEVEKMASYTRVPGGFGGGQRGPPGY